LASFTAIGLTYGLAIGLVATIGWPWWFTVSAGIGALVVATGVARPASTQII